MYVGNMETGAMEAFGRRLEVKGYSVVDAIIVMSILGILVATAVPSYQIIRDQSRIVKTALAE